MGSPAIERFASLEEALAYHSGRPAKKKKIPILWDLLTGNPDLTNQDLYRVLQAKRIPVDLVLMGEVRRSVRAAQALPPSYALGKDTKASKRISLASAKKQDLAAKKAKKATGNSTALHRGTEELAQMLANETKDPSREAGEASAAALAWYAAAGPVAHAAPDHSLTLTQALGVVRHYMGVNDWVGVKIPRKGKATFSKIVTKVGEIE